MTHRNLIDFDGEEISEYLYTEHKLKFFNNNILFVDNEEIYYLVIDEHEENVDNEEMSFFSIAFQNIKGDDAEEDFSEEFGNHVRNFFELEEIYRGEFYENSNSIFDNLDDAEEKLIYFAMYLYEQDFPIIGIEDIGNGLCEECQHEQHKEENILNQLDFMKEN